jgi:oligoendopeptidase F
MKQEELKAYRHYVDDIIRRRAHILDEKTELLLAKLGGAASAPSEAFDKLESVALTFPEITDAYGKRVRQPSGSFGVYRASPDRRVRREAFEAYFGEFAKLRTH